MDRHGLSYLPVESFAKAHPGACLVLLDYHHDVGPLQGEPTSASWVGMLLERKIVSKVLWVSGRDLLTPNRNARMAWLHRKLSSFAPSEAASIAGGIELCDWHELEQRRIEGPLAITLDLDILCHDPGQPPERFLDEMARWMGRQRPGLVTVALSAAYQKGSAQAWAWLERFVREYGAMGRGARWLLDAGPFSARAEGEEEKAAWRLWESRPEAFQRQGEAFWPGAAIWLGAPPSLRSSLLDAKVEAGDASAAAVLSGWRDSDLSALEAGFGRERTDAMLSAAASALEELWRGARIEAPEPVPAVELGVALRLSRGDSDRGCLALYRGVAEPLAAARYCAQAAAADPRYAPVLSSERPLLSLELCAFGPWRDMNGPLDFRPGLDSLLLVRGGETTLLQAPVAVERGYDREAFLGRLSLKAGLPRDGWKEGGLVFRRAASVWSRRAMADIEADSQGSQKKEKK
jgi:AMMECR1 domain-containing protein